MKPKQLIIPGSDGNHLSRLREKLTTNPTRPGTVNHVAVLHDDWCDLLSRKGPCNCDPKLQVLGGEQ